MLLAFTVKIILAAFLFLFLIYPVYKFIFLISARKHTLKEFNKKKKYIKKKYIIYAIFITLFFSLMYSFKVFSNEIQL